MSNLLVYQVTVGPVVDADVVERRLSVTINGNAAAALVRSYPADATDLGTFSAPQNSEVVLALVDVDDAGNASEPAYFEFEAMDTLPPAKPSGFGVVLVAEKSEADADKGGGDA